MVEPISEAELAPFYIRDLEALRIVSDPLRVRILGAASNPATVKEIGASLGVAPGKLYYHVELLERHGLLVVDSSRIVSGITEKRYRTVSRDIRVDRTVLGTGAPELALDALLAAVFDATRAEAERSARAGKLHLGAPAGAPDAALLARMQVRLAPETAVRVRAAIDAVLAEARASGDDDGLPSYDLTVAFFPTATGD